MERIIKYVIVFLFLLLVMTPAQAEDSMNLSTLITSQNISFENCTKVFNVDNHSLLYLTISAVNANRFKIDEIQTQSGYILFTAVNKQFLANVSNVNTNQSLLKITPVDGHYYFQPGIVLNIYKYIDLNLQKKPTVIF